MKNFIDNLETIASNKDSLFKTVINLDGEKIFSHTQILMLESVWNSVNNKIEEIKKNRQRKFNAKDHKIRTTNNRIDN